MEDSKRMPDNEKQVTWGGRFGSKPDDLMQVFGESISFDRRLAPYDLQGSLGHAGMLAEVGLLTPGNAVDSSAITSAPGVSVATTSFR